ncbi:glucose-1-phosphatase-like [Pectinophora gossypiella]|uniref:glucose-1-phosphatase-like n=1 Tax=Pectinophora gossypiella TaxID=13191 RepID=UPI00214F3051|nr:glucose-1-phosphatase-like [Pectinophora gossypiella]
MAAKFLLFAFIMCSDVIAYKLTQVLIISRHNVRAPLTLGLEEVTPKIWPKWREEIGHLTSKGMLLESYMGEYFSQWFMKEGLFNKSCPQEESVYIYANAVQRTRETARIFSENAFKNCNLKVNFKANVTTDPVFHPVILNDNETFKDIAVNEMQKKLDELQLRDAYLKLNKILSFNESKICKEKSFCNLAEAKDRVLFKIGEEPDIYGPLHIGNVVVDNFLMSYYSGMPLKNIGWGEIQPEMWESLTRISKENQNVRFNTTSLGQHVAKPLLKVMHEVLTNDKLKLTLLVGHDSNINSIIAAIGFKPFDLPNHFERTPVGGKLVFQKLYDKILNRYLLKINYVYQSTEQTRHGMKLSLKSPPKSVQLVLKTCSLDKSDLCPWDDFIKIMEKFK